MPFFYVAYTTIILLHNLIEAVNAMAMMKNVGKLPDLSQNTIHCQNIAIRRGNSQKFQRKNNLFEKNKFNKPYPRYF